MQIDIAEDFRVIGLYVGLFCFQLAAQTEKTDKQLDKQAGNADILKCTLRGKLIGIRYGEFLCNHIHQAADGAVFRHQGYSRVTFHGGKKGFGLSLFIAENFNSTGERIVVVGNHLIFQRRIYLEYIADLPWHNGNNGVGCKRVLTVLHRHFS